MQQAAFDALGIDASYEAIEAGREHGAEVFARLRAQAYAGWNVTTPLKEAAALLVDRVSRDAAEVHAVNTVRADSDGSLVGINTDGGGLLRAVRELWDWQPGEGTVLILGSGPAARAIAHSLRAGGATALACWSRDALRAARIAVPLSGTPELVISALSADAEIPAHIMAAPDDETMIFDLNYGRTRSPVARMRGRRRSDGLALLLHQGALAFEWWTGRPAPLDVMRIALHADST
jgi:shikimate dehydrogenase